MPEKSKTPTIEDTPEEDGGTHADPKEEEQETKRLCGNCKTPESARVTLMACAGCRKVQYCSKTCQKADWKKHKPSCSVKKRPKDAPAAAATAAAPPPPARSAIDRPFHALHDGIWLHGRPKDDVYRLLIDAFRLRQEDDYQFQGDVEADSVYGGAAHSLRPFRTFLAAAKARRPAILPPWWTDEDDEAVVRVGMAAQPQSSSLLATTVEKADIMAYYGSPLMPMQLRMLVEQIVGSGPMGIDGTAMMRMQMEMEKGNMRGLETSLMSLGV